MQQMINQSMPLQPAMPVGDGGRSQVDETYYMMPPGIPVQDGMWNWTDSGAETGVGEMIPEGGGQMPVGPVQGMGGMTPLNSVSSQQAQSQRMKNPVDMSVTHSPADSGEAYQASLRSLLARNVGYFVVCTFQIGTQQTVTWQGILHTVGSDYLVLYQPDHGRYVSCDFYALKFVQFHNVKGIPYCAAVRAWEGRKEM